MAIILFTRRPCMYPCMQQTVGQISRASPPQQTMIDTGMKLPQSAIQMPAHLHVAPPNVGIQDTQKAQYSCPAAYGADDLCLALPVGMNPLNEVRKAIADRSCSSTRRLQIRHTLPRRSRTPDNRGAAGLYQILGLQCHSTIVLWLLRSALPGRAWADA